MKQYLILNVKYSTSHMFFPKIVIGILLLLGAVIVVKNILLKIKSGQPVFNKEWRFFEKGFDKLKLFGSMALFIAYVAALKPLGFLVASIIFIFLFNVLFCGTLKLKSLAVSAAVSLISSVSIWYLFGVLFRITLP